MAIHSRNIGIVAINDFVSDPDWNHAGEHWLGVLGLRQDLLELMSGYLVQPEQFFILKLFPQDLPAPCTLEKWPSTSADSGSRTISAEQRPLRRALLSGLSIGCLFV